MKDLLREYIELILEGFKENQDMLIQKYPDFEHVLKTMNPKEIEWLYSRFMSDKRIEEVHPFEDALETLKTYSAKSVGINQKYASNRDFKTLIDGEFPNQGRRWNTPADFRFMSSDDMEKIIRLSMRKKQRIDAGEHKLPMEDFIGKFGEWNLWMPTTRENSINIAGYDPETMEPRTTWCTARTSGSNLFYNYAGQGTILFYIIKDNPTGDNDWLSVGFVKGKAILDGRNGGVSVNRSNVGLTKRKLNSILGGQYQQIMNKLEETNLKNEGKHPSFTKIEDASKDINVFFSLIKGLSKSEADQIKGIVYFTNPNSIHPEVLLELSKGESQDYYKIKLARSENIPVECLINLANNESEAIRMEVAKNHKTPIEVLKKLASDKSKYVKISLLQKESHHVPLEIINFLCSDKDSDVRSDAVLNPKISLEQALSTVKTLDEKGKNKVAENSNRKEIINFLLSDNNSNSGFKASIGLNKNASIIILDNLSNDPDWHVRRNVAANIKTPVSTLERLAYDKDEVVKGAVASNKKTPAHSLEILASSEFDHSSYSFMQIAQNKKCTPETLRKLYDRFKDKLAEYFKSPRESKYFWVYDLMRYIVENRNVPNDVLEMLSDSNSEVLQISVAKSKNASPELLKKMAEKKSEYVRIEVAVNSNTPEDTLRILAKSPEPKVSFGAKKNLKSKNLMEQYIRIVLNGMIKSRLKLEI